MIKQLLKATFCRVCPRWSTEFFSARSRAYSQRLFRDIGCRDVGDQLISRLGATVIDGPFQGLTLTPMTHAEQIGPYLLGTYEYELHDAWRLIMQGQYDTIVDIGAKFGYYAVGLASAFPSAQLYAIDTDHWARRALAEMCAANGAHNVRIRSICNWAWLSTSLTGSSLVVSDCEGYEAELFTSEPTDRLTDAVLLIEVHDSIRPGVGHDIREHLSATHDIFVISASRRDVASGKDLTFLTADQQRMATHEIRGPQEWMVCLPLSGANKALRQAYKSSLDESETVRLAS